MQHDSLVCADVSLLRIGKLNFMSVCIISGSVYSLMSLQCSWDLIDVPTVIYRSLAASHQFIILPSPYGP